MAVQGPGRNVPDFCEAVCGDGLLVLGEECDDGNVATGDGCGPNCLLEQQGTSCPPASDGLGGVCRATCGDGVRGPVEECDDGNSVSGDGCSATCQVERGFTCSGGGLKSMDTCWPICGDGLRVDRTYAPTLAADKLEGCDTGPLPSRGCDASCQVRVGWRCARPQGQGEEVCVPVCGDGILSTPMEECDDMNLQSGDGCSPDCKVEAFFECTYDDFWLRSVCKVHCGDGRKHPSEACDDGNVWDEDGCSSNCQAEAGFECLGGGLTLPSTCIPICGDGYEVFGEGCDDGNQNPWDGCDQFCQVEQGYHCTRAPKPGQTGAASACSPTCGDGLLNGEEECDGSYSPLPGNTTEPPVPCSRCRLLAVDVCGDFRRGPTEQCDDGNNASGDGCSSSCDVETGWSCSQGPSHLSPGVAPGDTCRAICGDGIVVSTEACDDGNLRGDDGCTGDCRVEALFECFLPGAAQLLEVPEPARTNRGPMASVCVSTKPPRFVGAHFDEAFVSLELNFDSNVAPLPGEEHSGGVATAVPAFPCEVLLDPLTLLLLGDEPSCWWKSRQSAAVAMGGSLGILPGSGVLLKAGVLRSYTFAKEAAAAQEVKADVPGGFIAPVLWPRPIITGAQMAPACADVTVLSSEYSQGFAGRMAMPPRWAVVAAFNMTAASWDSAEVERIQRGMEMQFQDAEVYLPRQGVLLSLLDLEFDRSIRVGFIYRICLRQQNMLDLVGIGCHNLEINELPVPRVVTAVPQHPMALMEGRWLQLEVKAELPQGCVTGDPPRPTTLLAASAPEPTHSLRLEEPLRLVRALWSFDTSLRNALGEAISVPLLSSSRSVGEERYGNRSVASQLFLRPGTLPTGYVNVYSQVCVNASKNLTETEVLLGLLPTEEVCGYTTFAVNHLSLPVPPLSLTTERPWRRVAEVGEVLAAAAAGAELRLVGTPPAPGAAPQGPPVEAEVGVDSLALQRLRVLEDVGNNAMRAEELQYGWLGAVEPEDSTTVLGAILVPPNTSTYAPQLLSKAMAALVPVVTWSVTAATRNGAAVVVEPIASQPSAGGGFLSIGPGQLAPGSEILVEVEMALVPPGDAGSSSCPVPLRTMRQEAVLAVNLPPAAGYLKVEESQVNSPLRTLMLENMRWSSEVLPLQYRFEAAHLQAQGERRLFLSDWSYDPKLTVVFLPRTEEKLLLRGQVRDGRGTFAATAPETVQLISSASDESGLRAITEFQQGRMSAADYSSRKVGESIAQIQAAAADLEPLQQLQLWQDVAFAALSDADNITVSNCSKDCGPNGACPDPEYVVMVGNTVVAANASPNTPVSGGERLLQVQSWTRCVCNTGWQGQACESRTFEAQSQELLTKTVTEALQGLLGSAHQLQVLGITYKQGALARLMRLLGRLCEDCRRVSLNVLASITGLAAGLAAALPKAALRVAATDTAALMSRIYSCLPDEAPSNSMAQMPAPATVLLTALGSSEVCRPINGTNTTVCYDLASSEVQMTCPSAGRQYQADIYLNPSTATSSGVEVSCRANLNLGLSEPYPCPCSVPEGTFLGFGRSGKEPSLSETLGLRNEKDILWRELLKLFWNNTKYGGNGSSIRVPQPGPALAAALWLEETGAPTSEVSAALAQAEHWRLVQQGTLAALQTLGESLVAALLAGVHPGQAARSVDALPMVASWAAPSVMETNASQGRMGIASVPLDSLGTRIELEYQASDETISGTRLPGALPYKVPLGALRWKNKSHNLYSKMDPSVRVHSDVVQLQLLAESSQTSSSNLTKLRYHFMVPELPQPNRCEALRPTKDRLELCCNASRSSIGSFADFSCLRPFESSQASVVSARRLEDRSGNDQVADGRRLQSQAKEAALVQLFGRRVPFQAGLEDLLEDVRIWTASTQRVMLAGTRLRLQGGNMKVQRACDSRGNAAERLLVREGLLLQEPDAGWSTDAWCRTVFDRARLLQSSVPSWQTFADALLQAAEEVEADPSLVPTSSTVTTSTTTSTTLSTLTGTTSTYTGTQTSNTTTTATSSTSSYSSTASFTSSTHTSSTSTMSRTSTRSLTTTTSLTLSTTSSTDSTTTQNITTSSTTSATTTEIPWCSRGDQAQIDTWCPSGVTLETELPVYADAELADEQGVLLFGVFGVQLSMQGSSALTVGLPPPGQLTLLSTERSLVFLHAMALIYTSWIDSWVEAHELSNASYVLRHWAPEPSTLTTSSTTFTGTSSTATTSTTTRPVVAFPQPQPASASGAVLSTLEVVFSDPLELLTRALQMDLENNDGLPRLTDSSSSGSLAIRGMATSSLLHSWCEVPALAPTQRLADVLAALEPIVLNLNDTTGLRPLHTVLAALEEGLPSEWDANYWSNAPGGPGWEPPLPTATSTTWTSTSTIDMESVLCPDVECLPPDDCGLDPLMDLECVAWSAPLRRFVPALGCELVAQPGRQWPIVQQGSLEVVCECEAWALHPAMAVASKLPALTPFPPQVQIQTREVAVFWLDKAHSYNLRGLFIPPVLLLVAALHLLLAIYAEVRWRSQARWVAMRTMRAKGVQVEVQQLDAEEKDFIRRRAAEIRATGEFSAAICAAEAQEIVRRAEGLPHASTSAAARLDIRQAKDGLATLFQAHGLGDVEDDEVRRPPPLALMGPGGLQPPGTTVVTSSLSKATPSLLTPSARMPSATGSPMQALSLRDASLRDAAQEVGFRPEEAMISSKPPTKPRRGLRGMIVDGVWRCRRKHIWRACLTHHKIFFLSDDSQTFIFSAPERAAMLHASLWINAVWLSVVLGGFEHRRPFQEPACLRDADEFRLAEVGCLFESASVGLAVLAAALTPPVAGALQTFCRGRSFVVRAKDLSVEDRDRAFTRHFLGPWPSVLMAPAEAKVRLWNVFCNICRFCCPRGCPRPRRRKLLPLHWWPSLVLPSLVLLICLVAWRLCFYMFHFSTSIYMWETTQTDQPGRVEIQLPPDEQAEASAAGADETWQLRLVLVPEMQRYIVLLAISWFLNLLLFEPLMLILHLFVGEPSVDECLRPVLPIILLVPRAMSVCCSVLGKCLDRLGSCLQRFWPERLVLKVRSLCGPCSSCKRWCRFRSCRWCRCKRTEVEPISPPDLTETIESEDEDEASKKDKKGKKNKKAERAEKGKKESKAETT
ncbi:psiR [Symbiodinium sp. CCMP2592]|nr:psiR [Symbiodinium sp. CCMP2592]